MCTSEGNLGQKVCTERAGEARLLTRTVTIMTVVRGQRPQRLQPRLRDYGDYRPANFG